MSEHMTENDVIDAKEMVDQVIYKTCDSDLSYFAKIESVRENDLTISALMPKTKKWKKVEVPHTYKVRGLNQEEKEEFSKLLERIARPKKEKVAKAPRDPNAPKRLPPTKIKGVITGKGMVEAWAYYIDKNIRTVGGLTQTVKDMVAEFPTKVESIQKWVSVYPTYYQSGRFSQYGFPRLAETTPWLLSEAELAAGLKQVKVRPLAKEPVKRVKKEASEPAAV